MLAGTGGGRRRRGRSSRGGRRGGRRSGGTTAACPPAAGAAAGQEDVLDGCGGPEAAGQLAAVRLHRWVLCGFGNRGTLTATLDEQKMLISMHHGSCVDHRECAWCHRCKVLMGPKFMDWDAVGGNIDAHQRQAARRFARLKVGTCFRLLCIVNTTK